MCTYHSQSSSMYVVCTTASPPVCILCATASPPARSVYCSQSSSIHVVCATVSFSRIEYLLGQQTHLGHSRQIHRFYNNDHKSFMGIHISKCHNPQVQKELHQFPDFLIAIKVRNRLKESIVSSRSHLAPFRLYSNMYTIA